MQGKKNGEEYTKLNGYGGTTKCIVEGLYVRLWINRYTYKGFSQSLLNLCWAVLPNLFIYIFDAPIGLVYVPFIVFIYLLIVCFSIFSHELG